MIYSVNFTDMAGRINSLAFIKYLKETGWQQFVTKKTSIRIFQYENGNIFEQVTIPIDKSLRDYNSAMYEAVKTVSTVENKTVEQVMLYLLNPNTDIIKIRLDKLGIESGNIILDDAIKLYDNAKKLLAATALDIINPKKYHYGRPDDPVQKFLSQCRFGQTEIGSYVVSVVCPFAEVTEEEGYKQLTIFSDEETCANSLTRKVTNKLMENICTIKREIDNGEGDTLIQEFEKNMISANFYEALNGLNLDSDNTIVEFSVFWSPTVKNNQYHCSDVKLTSDYYQPISAVIQKLKEQTNKSKEIVGRIRKLEALPVVDKRRYGTVAITYIGDDNKSHTVTTKLEKLDYDKAIAAHQLGKYVKIVGEIKEGNNSIMDSTSFSIVE